jgi:hypothetical protein
MNGFKNQIFFKNTCCFLLLLLFMTGGIKAQQFKFNNGRKQQSLYFNLIKNLIIIPIYINDKGPFDFILDTGVNPMIITDPSLKESLKVPYTRAIKISGYGDFDGVDAFLGVTSVNVGDASADHIPTIFLKDDILPLSGYVGRKIYGLIGYNFFNSFIVKVSYTNKSLKMISPEKKVKLKGEKIPFTLIDNKPYVSVEIEQEGLGKTKLQALLDCGAGHSISLETLNGTLFPKPDFTLKANLGNGLTGSVTGQIGRINALKLGSFDFKDVLANYPNYNIDSLKKGRNANLGAEIMGRFNTIYDYPNRVIYLKKNENFNKPFEHDMAGIEIYSEHGPPSRTVITRIEPQSPADLVGLKEGDELTRINFKSVDDYSLDEIASIFKAKNGYSVIVEVWRDRSFQIKLLKLKKRI